MVLGGRPPGRVGSRRFLLLRKAALRGLSSFLAGDDREQRLERIALGEQAPVCGCGGTTAGPVTLLGEPATKRVRDAGTPNLSGASLMAPAVACRRPLPQLSARLDSSRHCVPTAGPPATSSHGGCKSNNAVKTSKNRVVHRPRRLYIWCSVYTKGNMSDDTLDGYIAGYVDGEGSFSVSVQRNPSCRIGLQLVPELHVSQNGDRAQSFGAHSQAIGVWLHQAQQQARPRAGVRGPRSPRARRSYRSSSVSLSSRRSALTSRSSPKSFEPWLAVAT